MDQQLQKLLNRDVLKGAIIAILILAFLFIVFSFGMWIGAQKAKFSCRWAENYQRNFAGPRGGFMGDWQKFPMGDLLEGHGVFGKIIKIESNSLAIDGTGKAEKVILIKSDTVIKNLNGDLKLSDLKIDDFVTVVGSPNDSGQIEAKLIRVMPAPPEFMVQNKPNNNQPNNSQNQ